MPAIDAKEALKDSVCFRVRLKCVPLSIQSINRPPVSGNTITKIDPDMSMACHGPKNVTPAENRQRRKSNKSISMQANFPAGRIPLGSPEGGGCLATEK